MRKSKIPKFHSYKEEAEFWDKEDSAKHLSEFKPASVKFSKPKMRVVSMKLPEPEVAGLKKIAEKKGIEYRALIRIWVTERFVSELKKAA